MLLNFFHWLTSLIKLTQVLLFSDYVSEKWDDNTIESWKWGYVCEGINRMLNRELSIFGICYFIIKYLLSDHNILANIFQLLYCLFPS